MSCMARLSYIEEGDLAPADRDLALDINVSRILAHSPGGARSRAVNARYIRDESRLDGRLRELALLVIALRSRSTYAWAHHVKIAGRCGASDADIRAVAAELAGGQTHLDPLAKAVVRAAREMYEDLAMSQTTFDELLAALGPEILVDLAGAIANFTGMVRILATFQVDLEDEYRPYLEAFPL
jgi:alkylhydroperoxidase family enzyme